MVKYLRQYRTIRRRNPSRISRRVIDGSFLACSRVENDVIVAGGGLTGVAASVSLDEDVPVQRASVGRIRKILAESGAFTGI